MNNLTDQQLLRDYAERQSETAFAAIVHRYVDLVYSVALRLSCDAHAANDVTQGVFVALAQNAKQLTDRPALVGWLHCTARNLAAKTVRSEVRRRAREQEVAVMNQILSAVPDSSWEHIAPCLDEALGELDDTDRDAVLLRYFKNHDLRTVGATLGISDDAAQKRVSRAVERLREFFAKRGVTVGASGLAVVISANAVQAAPVGLALTISAAAALTGATLATTATVTATKAIAMTALQKTLVAATIAALAGAGIYATRENSKLRDQVQTLQQQQAIQAEQNAQLLSDCNDATNRLALLADEKRRLNQNSVELLKLRGEVAGLRRAATELDLLKAAMTGKVDDSSGNGFRSFVAEEMKQSATNSALIEIKMMEEKLGLTPEQAQAIRDIRFKYIEAHARKTVGEFIGTLPVEERNALVNTFAAEKAEITTTLSLEQRAAYEQMGEDKASESNSRYASSAASEMKDSLHLTKEQQMAVAAVLSELGPANALASDAPSQVDARLRALESILTPEQLQAYRQQMLGKIERAAKMEKVVKSLLGK